MTPDPRGHRHHYAPLGSTLLVALLAGAVPAVAQGLPGTDFRGRAVVGDAPLAAATVVLQRIAAGGHGPVATATTDPEGYFRFPAPALPEEATEELVFAVVTHQGITYNGPALTTRGQLGQEYLIQVFDTAVAEDVALPVGRNVIFEPDGDHWRVTDIIRVRNEGETTLVPPAGKAVWRYPLPSAATDVTVNQQEALPGELSVGDGGVAFRSPLAPGERVFVARYSLPTPFGPIQLPGPTDFVDILMQEEGPPLVVEGLEYGGALELEPGLVFRRFSGGPLTDQVLVLEEGTGPAEIPVGWIAVGVSLLLLGVGLRSSVGAPAHRMDPDGPSRCDLLVAVARLDEDFERRAPSTPEDVVAHQHRRTALLEAARRARP